MLLITDSLTTLTSLIATAKTERTDLLDPEGSLSATTVVLLVVTLFEKRLRLC